MDKYKILEKGVFETVSKFEKRVNEMAVEGWKAISITLQGTRMYVLMERDR